MIRINLFIIFTRRSFGPCILLNWYTDIIICCWNRFLKLNHLAILCPPLWIVIRFLGYSAMLWALPLLFSYYLIFRHSCLKLCALCVRNFNELFANENKETVFILFLLCLWLDGSDNGWGRFAIVVAVVVVVGGGWFSN